VGRGGHSVALLDRRVQEWGGGKGRHMKFSDEKGGRGNQKEGKTGALEHQEGVNK